jgi:hypothetical protein
MSGKLTAHTQYDMLKHGNGFPLFMCISSNHHIKLRLWQSMIQLKRGSEFDAFICSHLYKSALIHITLFKYHYNSIKSHLGRKTTTGPSCLTTGNKYSK